ncbi:hypothetical protein KY289_023524 [Solanum tuberosum]|nr:hypothetical protein KY289_023524 [Solanum tuberosum]
MTGQKEQEFHDENNLQWQGYGMDFFDLARSFQIKRGTQYISLINIRARRRAVIIIPELTFNSGWTGIVEKVGRFINSHKRGGNLEKHRLVDNNIPYADLLRSIKWVNGGEKTYKQKTRLRGATNLHL